jgi:hypothetical protein
VETVDVFDGHDMVDGECIDCWSGFPAPCICGGMVHAEFGDYVGSGDGYGYYLDYRCSQGCDYPEPVG